MEWQHSCNLCKLHFMSKVMEAKLLGDFALVTELQKGWGCIWIQAGYLTQNCKHNYFVSMLYLGASQHHLSPSNHLLVTQLFCPVFFALVLISALPLAQAEKCFSVCLRGSLSESGCTFAWELHTAFLDNRPHPQRHVSIRRRWSDSTCQGSKILWHAASFPNEVHFSCKR